MVWFFSLSDKILASLLTTIGSIIMTSIILIIYLFKEQRRNVMSKLYHIMIILVSFMLITEVANTLCLAYDIENILYRILYSVHWLSFLGWFATYYIYCIAYFTDYNGESLIELFNSSIRVRIVSIGLVVACIVYFFFPYIDVTSENIRYIAGAKEYYIIGCLVVIGILILFDAFVKYRKMPTRRKVAVCLVLGFLAAFLILQILFQDICIYVIVCSLQIFFLYFITENPEIQLAKEIDKLKQDIEKSNRAKTDFLSNMSHEIRTPMNAIIGFSDSLLSSTTFDPEQAKKDIQNITVAGNNLLDIINNILDISKIEYGSEEIDNKEVSIKKIVDDLETIIKTRIGKSPISFIKELDPNTPSKVLTDSTKLHQVLLNILTNSVKYTEVGRIKLNLVTEYSQKEKNKVMCHFKISDTGYGIKKEDFDKLFQKFNRLDSALEKEIEGTGLGLVITKRLVELMGGKIWLESEYGVGTTFFLDIPFVVTDVTPIGEDVKIVKKNEEAEYLDCSGLTALIVDDNELNIKVAARLLGRYKFNIITSNSGTDCVYRFKSGEHYDIIFLDHMMPEMDGIETLHIIKKLSDYEIPPIVALTANAMTGMREMYLNEGFDYYLAKPINTDNLDKIIIDALYDKVQKNKDSNN